MPGARSQAWDLTALLNGADPKAELAARNLWLVRLMEWLRHPRQRSGDALPEAPSDRPLPLLRLKHLLNMLERNPAQAKAIAGVLGTVWRDIQPQGLFADVGFAPRMALWSELLHRLRQRVLPDTVDTRELGELFGLLFPTPEDELWLAALDDDLLTRLARLFAQAVPAGSIWREPMLGGLTVLVSGVRAAGLSGPLRQRMDPELLAHKPFAQLARAADGFADALHSADHAAMKPALQYLRVLLDSCRQAAESVPRHLEDYGVSVDIMFEVEQLLERLRRIEALLDCLVSKQPQRELARLAASLVRVVHERRSVRTLFARHYSLLARKVAERSAETGEHYITRNRAAYRDMLRRALGGGLVIAGTTFLKFAVMALALSAFWAGFWAGVNYAASFVLIHLMHWTVATKQPAMTAPAMAQKLQDIDQDSGLEGFVDEVAHLLRSQMAGIVGNLAMVAPVVLGVQMLSWLSFGAPLVGEKEAHHVLEALTLLGPTLLFAAFTGVLLFASSLIAGWVENWFVFYRIDAAIAWNPRIVARLGRARARRWADWWRANISGLAANVSLGMMLGLVPALLGFFALPIEVRHVTLSTGQLAAAAGAIGPDIVHQSAFWWCLAAIALTGALNLSVSFYLAFKVALRSRGIQVEDRARLSRAIWRRLWTQPRSFFFPPRP
jgi:site-specific recombinase